MGRNRKTSKVTESSVLQKCLKNKDLYQTFFKKLMHKTEDCQNKDVQKEKNHKNYINLQINQLLKAQLLAHVQSELLILNKWL